MAGTLHFSSVFSAESNRIGWCLTVTTAVPKSSRFSVSLFTLLDGVHIFRLASETRSSQGCDASSIAWAEFLSLEHSAEV